MRLKFYKDRKHEWRWRLIARNGRIVANCGEGYRRLVDCERIAHKLFDHVLG